ncbi:MAG: hypothetical protein KDK62_01835 [Chlamydiia bacterium]|nr:hypothetical protein [Chlamydiia bacterium]
MKHLLLLLVPSLVFAYAPLTPKGRAITTFGFSQFDSTQFYDKEGDKLKSYNSFQRNLFSLEIEAGVTECDTLSFYLPVMEVLDHLNGNEYDLGDGAVSWRRGWLFWDDAIFSSEIALIFPFREQYLPDLRYGRYGLEGKLLYARSFFAKGYKTTFDGEIGCLWYAGFPSDQVRGRLSAWVDLSAYFQILAETHLDWGFFNGKEPLNPSFFFWNANYRVWSGRVALNLFFTERFMVSAGYMHHFWGQNIAVGGQWEVKGSYCF